MTGFWRGIGLSNADRDRVEAVLEIGEDLAGSLDAAAQSATDAGDYADQAEQARDAAVSAGNVFPNVVAGVQGTTEGEYFTTPTASEVTALIIYRHVANGGAEEVGRIAGDGAESTQLKPLNDMSRISAWGASEIFRMQDALQVMATEFGADFFPAGNNGQDSAAIWGEQGSRPMQIRFPNDVVPATSDPVVVTFTNGTPRAGIRARRVVIEGTGIEGVLQGATVSGSPVLRFTRSGVVAGFSHPIQINGAVNSIAIPGNEWSTSLQIWAVGGNDIVYQPSSYPDVISRLQNAWRVLPTLDKRVLVIGPTAQRDTQIASDFRDAVNAINAFDLDFFGERYIDIQSYMTSSQVWIDTGITPTTQDLQRQSIGNLPPSLTTDGAHFTPVMNTAIVQNLIKPRLYALGWYSEA